MRNRERRKKMNIQPQSNDIFSPGSSAVDQSGFLTGNPDTSSFSRFDSFLNERGQLPNTLSFPDPRSAIMPPNRAPSAPIVVVCNFFSSPFPKCVFHVVVCF